jgi:hypothetical protein
VEGAAASGELMPLRALAGRFPTTAQRFSLAYDESVSAIDFLIRAHGQDALVRLIRSYAGGVSDDETFTAALGLDVDAFEAAWLADLGVEEPPAFGPQPAPPGPLPPGWVAGPGPTAGPIATPRPGPPLPAVDDLVGPILAIAIGIIAVVLVVGLIVIGRRLNRGEPLMPPLVRADQEAAQDAWDGDDLATDDLAADDPEPEHAAPEEPEDR